MAIVPTEERRVIVPHLVSEKGKCEELYKILFYKDKTGDHWELVDGGEKLIAPLDLVYSACATMVWRSKDGVHVFKIKAKRDRTEVKYTKLIGSEIFVRQMHLKNECRAKSKMKVE